MPRISINLIVLFLFYLCPHIAYGQVSAGFTVDNATGCTPLIVHFTNTSADATSYSWNLGNSTSTTATDPSASYATAGTYTVTLTAFNGPSSSTSTMVITVYPLPFVGFTADDTTLCPGFPVTFTNTSSGGTPGPVTYTWNFGDGSTSGATSPVYTHATPGYYNITLFATNSMGCSRSLSKTAHIRVYTPPVPGYSGSGTYICQAPSSVAFANTSTGTPPLTYNWSFGDGSPSSGLTNPSHIYAVPGSFDVRLRVTDGFGCIDTLRSNGYVFVGNLVGSFSAPASICQLLGASFTNTSSSHLSSEWDFGDGFTSTDEMPVHAFPVPGTYNTRLIVFDGSCYDTVVHPITVHANPTGSFTVNPANPCPAPVALSYSATMPPGCSASWKLLDNATGAGATVTRTYSFGRIDTAVLTVTNGNGCSIVVEKIDTVYNLILTPQATKPMGCIPLTTSFLCSASASAYFPLTEEIITMPMPYVITNYSWNFGDGSPPVTGPSPSHTFTNVGIYTVSCTITTSSGCTKIVTTPVQAGVPPVVTFTATPGHLCAGRYVNFNSTGSPTITTYKWQYGDGDLDTGGIGYYARVHKYRVPGIDTVRLKAYYNGCASPEVKSWILIDSPNAVPQFNHLCIPNNSIAFGDSSLGTDSRLWIFDDGATSTLKNPVHDYAVPDLYSVRLATYNATSGCRDTMAINVDLRPPLLYLFSPDNSICKDQETSIFSFIIGASAEKYRWYVDGLLMDTTTPDVLTMPYHTQGFHDVTIIIKNSRGCFDTLVKDDFILVGNPVANFSITPPSGCGPLTVNFTDHSAGIPECRVVGYQWSFGDGSFDFVSITPGAAYTFSTAGSYDVGLTVIDSIGCTASTSPPGHVNVYRPHSAFYADLNNVCLGTNVHFNNISTGFASSYWMFGDGTTSTAASPYHIYPSSGVYTVKLAVTDSHGCSDTATLLNYIYVAPSPNAAFGMSDTFAVCPPLNVNFTNTSTSAVSYNWNFGNSTSSVAVNPSSPYAASGYYTVRLVAYNSIGCTDTAIGHVNIFGYTGAFSYTPTGGCVPLPVHFNATLGSIANIVWDFGDGYTSSILSHDTVSHLYSTQGMYVPKLILTDATGCTNFSVGVDTVKVDFVTPNFNITPNPVCQGSPATFTSASFSSFSPSAAWAWSFGGGATGSGISTAHTFTMAGTHSVTLAVTNASGCTASIAKNVTVNPVPGAITGTLTVCRGFTTALGNSIPGGSWTSGAATIASVSAGGVVTGLNAGTAKITYTLSAGCEAITTVTVYALPAAITGTNVICAGLTTTLNSTTAGGTWSSTNTPSVPVHLTSGVVTGSGAGTATIIYTLATGCTATKDVTINPVPMPITGITAVCIDNTTTLYESTGGGAWSSGTPSAGTIDGGGIVTGIAAGTTRITYAFPTGCKVTTLVTVNSLPDVITGTATLCNGGITALANSSGGGVWSSGHPLVAVAHPVIGTVFGMGVGTAMITYSLGTGCVATREVTVNTIPVPIAGTARLCQEGTTTLYESVTGGTWSSGNLPVATIDAGGIVTGVGAGTANITYALGSGCMVTRVVTVDPLPAAIMGNAGICYGVPSYLYNATAGGSWTSISTGVALISSMGLVSPLTYGTAIISYTLPTGCARGVTVTVNPVPDPITGVANVCVGIPTMLSSATPGGTWMSGNTSVAIIDLSSGIFTGLAAGNVDITYTSGPGCVTTRTLTIEALPPPITGGPTVCAGFAVNLHNSMPGGVWSAAPGATGIGTLNTITGVVSGITPGTVTVSYTIMSGCTRDLVVTVLVLPPTITGSSNVCVAETMTLSNAVPGGTWTSSNTTKATIDPVTGIVTGVAAGGTIITYKTASGCYNIRHIVVNPVPSAIAGFGTVCEGASVFLSSAPAPGFWISDLTDTATVGALTGVVTGIRAGTATISYILATGCMATKIVTVLPTPPAITGNPHVCIGTSVTLANTMPDGIWISGTSGVATVGLLTGVVSSVMLGTSVISYAMPLTGCYATLTVTVQPLPNIYSVTGGGNYCAGGAGVPIGLSGSQPGVSYVLYYGAAATGYLSGTGLSLNFGPLTTAGMYTVHATSLVSGCVNNMAGSATVVVVPLVTPSVTIVASPNDTICPGTSVTVTPLTTNGGTSPVYEWKVNSTIVGSSPSYSFLPADGDTVTVTMTGNAYCPSAATVTAVRIMTVLSFETPVVNVLTSPGDTVCQFLEATFTAVPAFGGAAPVYTWVVNGLPQGSGATYSYVPNHGDVVNCSMTSNYLCRLANTVVSGDVTMAVDSMTPPRVSLAATPGLSVAVGTPVTLTAYAANVGLNPGYQWKVNGKAVPGATLSAYTGVFNNQDSIVCVVTSDGVCKGIDGFDWAFISVRPLEVVTAGTMAADIRLMPNPNKGDFSISGTLGTFSNEVVSVQVTDMLGQIIYNGYVTAKNGVIDEHLALRNNLANGMYMLNIEWGSEKKVFHFVIRQ